MCGICGFNFVDKKSLHQMCDLIEHRGPDDVGFYTSSKISIGMRRLAIIDLKTGAQPQHNEDEDIWIVFNGEIYNFIELTQQLEKKGHQFYTNSDTEVIIHSYEEWGERCLNKLRGQFAFCIYDSQKKQLFLARDHMGLKPLYYYFDGELFIFGSEIKTILCHNIPREVDRYAFNLYLSLGYVPFNLTLFKGIFKLPPANYLKFDLENKKLELKNYWNITFIINRNKSLNQLAEELKSLIINSVKIRLISDVPIGAFLSGGLDSSAIVGIMSELMEAPVKTFSIGFGENAASDETKYSRYVSEYYNTDHTEIIVNPSYYNLLPELVWHFDDLIADAAILPVHLMAKHAKKKMTVALTGDGADEVFAGYYYYYDPIKSKINKFLPKILLEKAMKLYNYIPVYELRHAISYHEQLKTKEGRYLRILLQVHDKEKSHIVPFMTKDVKSIIKSRFIDQLDIINQSINWDLKYQLPNQFNMKVDKMTMAASLEARVPFLDRKIVSWASSIPSEFKLKGEIEKYILRVAMKDILPQKILTRKKKGFGTPVNLWLKKALKDVTDEILERLTKRKDLVKPDFIKLVIKNKLNPKFRKLPWNLIMFEIWYETFIENMSLNPIKL